MKGDAVFAAGVAFTVLDLFGAVELRVVIAAQLLAISFLVFHTAAPDRRRRPADILRDREAFGSFPALLQGVRDLRVYGPTAINVVVHLAEIQRVVLDRGGNVRVVVQAPDPQQLLYTAVQLDQGLDVGHTLNASLRSLDRLSGTAGFSHRLLPFNPGFSLVVVDAAESHGYVIVEPHGFADETAKDRMHLMITKAESPRWFAYWSGRFDAIWDASNPAEAPAPAAPREVAASGWPGPAPGTACSQPSWWPAAASS